ncbi:cysteine hydrolase family protein [Ideonella sp. BN130291]|uniref:cysteine hydrolase family protein n=1 Tax=Ideonella sp. BN130291 TaxID=3112940 RepID=UPI002E270425|nr:cysteine hydrolase family protein [Ideonella sp. BN130291]
MTATTNSPRRALVVIDVQNEYFAGGGLPIEYPPVEQTLPKIAAAMDAARAAGVPVVVVQNTAPAGSPLFDRGTPGWQLHPEIERRGHDHFIDKAWPSAFTGTDLADWIAEHRIDTLTVAGYMTHNCNASTILEATHRGLQVEFLSDASGALPYANAAGRASAEEIHRVFSVVFHTRFAAVATTAAWVDALQTGNPLPRDNIVASNRRALGAA